MKKLILLFCLSILLFSCTKIEEKIATIPPQIPVKVYIAGSYYQTKDKATVWKSGVSTFLNDGTNAAYAYGVAVNGGDVYTVGYENNSGAISEARLWKNDVVQTLQNTSSTLPSVANFISIVTNDVYVLGKNNGVVKYWKNGTENAVSGINANATLYAFSVINTDMYIVYTENSLAYLWKNGTITQLSDGVKPDTLNTSCLAISNGDVYVVAKEVYNGQTNIKYWKNGTATYVATLTGVCDVFGIDVVNNDVYIGGFSNDKATYWKNNVSTVLTTGTTSSKVLAIKVFDNKVYTAGIENNKLRIWQDDKVFYSNADVSATTSDKPNTMIVFK